ncbi:hypothetical protein DWV34_11625 [Anaerostipes sp. AF04-45]|nr:hypothetical protein DWV34_11625 [Anaerostipes sp. AF04-45]
MDILSAEAGCLETKGATFRKLFTTIGGAHFKSATEIVVNNSYLQGTPYFIPFGWTCFAR